MKLNIKYRNAGFTLVELLVVITILAILVALTIPQLRVINRDRGVRESARVVGAAFASASQQAVIDGSAGILIVRNQNVVNPDVNNAANTTQYNTATTLYRMRAIPDYTGLDASDNAIQAVDLVTGIPKAFHIEISAPPANIIIRRGDRITLGERNLSYRILDVAPGQNGTDPDTRWLLLETAGNATGPSLPMPDMTVPMEFRISLRPRVVESSRVDLPAGYVIDLRYSGIAIDVAGESVPRNASNMCSAGLPVLDSGGMPTGAEVPISIIFDSTGGIDRVFGLAASELPIGGFLAMVAEDALANADPIASDNSLWIKVDESGVTSVSSNVGQPPTDPPTPLKTRIENARVISLTRQTASQ